MVRNWLLLPDFLLFLASRLHFPVDVNAPTKVTATTKVTAPMSNSDP